MSIRLMSEVFECRNLSSTEKLVMLCLADHADDNGRCYPSIDRIADRSALGARAVQTNIRELVRRGFISIARGGGRGRANEYIVSVKGEPKTPFAKHRLQNTVYDGVNPAPDSLNPAPDAPQPSLTIIEPSEEEIIAPRPKSSSKQVLEILMKYVSQEAAESFIAHRKMIRKPMSEVAAKSISKTLAEILSAGFNPDDALALAEERGWASIKTDWFMKENANDRKQAFNGNATGRPYPSGNGQPRGLVGAAMRAIANGTGGDEARGGASGRNADPGDIRPPPSYKD